MRLVVSYDRTLTKLMTDYYNLHEIDNCNYKQEKYKLYKISLTEERHIYFLSTPFFGNGQISYDGLRKAAQRIKGNRGTSSVLV